MSLWEYKVITSGKGGFATPALLEKFLNDLGRDEWEIIHFQTPPENFLAFTGLVRRSTQRDWTLEDAAAAAAKAEAEKLRAEFEAKFKAAASSTPTPAEDRSSAFLEEKVAPDDGFRKPVDTSRDDDPEAQEDEKADEWDKLTAAEEDELPTFFEAIKPHMRRNQRGPGMSVGVDYLAKKWDQSEDDLKAALTECGFVVPKDEDDKVEYVEYDGDLYWLNINRRGELWINTKEKPRPVFRSVKAPRVEIEAPTTPVREKSETGGRKLETGDRKPESGEANAPSEETSSRPEGVEGGDASPAEPQTQNARPQTAAAAASAPLPQGPVLLDKIRPHMRRNRRGPGGSGSTSFLSRALRTNEADLKAAFTALGLTIPATPNDKPVYSEIGGEVWWLNVDSRGGLWVNGREKKEGESLTPAAESSTDATVATPMETAPASATLDAVPAPEVVPSVATAESSTPAAPLPTSTEIPSEITPQAPLAAADSALAAPVEAVPANPVVAGVRLLLKETKTGSVAGKVDRLAEELGKLPEDFLATLVGAGFRVPEKPREKPVFVESGGEILWLNRNAKGELWLNAKASKYADKDADDEEGEANDSSEGGEGEGEKKAGRRGGRARPKKPEAGEAGKS